MKVAEAIRAAAEQLQVTSDTARLDAELLMAHCFGIGRSELLLGYMGHTAPKRFASLVERRATHEPVAYLTGEAEFFGRTFHVTHDVLIPRSDSEALIETALEIKHDASRVLDIGTGSGALLLSFLCETQAHGIGIDSSARALGVADINLNALIAFNRASLDNRDWRKPNWTKRLGQFDLILCNPPYVEENAQLDPDVLNFEPASALFAGPDGLDDYRILIPQLRPLMSEHAKALLEIGHTQADAVTHLAYESGFAVEMRRDLAGRPRVLILS